VGAVPNVTEALIVTAYGPFCTLPVVTLEQVAAGSINDFVRQNVREAGFLRRIVPSFTISNDELDRAVDTDRPIKVLDRPMDLRQQLADSAIRDLMAEMDADFLRSVNALIPEQVPEEPAKLTRDMIVFAKNVLPKVKWEPSPVTLTEEDLELVRQWGDE
jgi:hypothetical protein